jgi:carboxyl-terminal processing protease
MREFRFKKSGSFLATLSISILVFLLLSFLVLPARSLPKQLPTLAVFDEVWQKVNDNFYDPRFNGVDWKAMRSKYEPLVKQTKSEEEVSVVINRMLSELNTSHTHFYTKLKPAYYQLLGIFNGGSFLKELKKFFPNGNLEYTDIGVFTKEINGKTFITAILDGSPAAKAGLKVGDQVLAIDANKYEPIQSFVNTGKNVRISIQQTPDTKSIKNLNLIPKKLNPNTMFLEAMRESIEIIKRDQRKIGYIHIWSYAGDQYQQLLEEEIAFGRLKQADGLILDLRDGWGGATPNYLNIFTDKVPLLTEISRNGTRTKLDFQWRKPVVMVVNNGTRSGKEILAYGFKQYRIGAVVGTKTAGAVLGGRPFLLQDGSLLYLAVVDVFVNGERLEGKGVTPDIEIPFRLEYAQGSDPQKQRAIEVLVEAVRNQGRGQTSGTTSVDS